MHGQTISYALIPSARGTHMTIRLNISSKEAAMTRDEQNNFIGEGALPVNKLLKFKLCGDIDATITGKLLYLTLSELANRNGEIIIPQRKISEALHISKKTVSRNLRRLHGKGYIIIQEQYRSDDGGRAANKYIIR
jgi:hypothetical protein